MGRHGTKVFQAKINRSTRIKRKKESPNPLRHELSEGIFMPENTYLLYNGRNKQNIERMEKGRRIMFLFQRIEETMMKYSDARHAVGEFILKEQENIYKYTIGEIAEKTYTSKATVVRFAKAMGYDGWKEFMKDYIAEVQHRKAHENDVDYNFPFEETDDMTTVLDNMQKLQIESILETRDLLDGQMLNEAAQRIIQSKNIVIFSRSPHSYYASAFARKLCSIGYLARVAISGEAGLISTALGKNDCAIIISYSGNNPTKEPMDKIKILKANHVPIIGITSGGENYIRKQVDCVLTMVSRERLYTKISNYSTEESLNFILNSLFSWVFAQNYRKNKNFKLQNSKMLEQERYTQIRDMKDIQI